MDHKVFTKELLEWSSDNARHLPWKGTKSVYTIWVSEIILQQTTVQQGTPYFYKFIEAYPDVYALANSSEQALMKIWEGLGYYTRARNMHRTANIIVNNFGGIFPSMHDELLRLPGIGPYTAAALMSFAFDKAYPVVDGNALRFISRILGVSLPVDSKEGVAMIKTFLEKSIKISPPASFNQAIMDMGATICKPRNPLCDRCPFQQKCIAAINHLQTIIPYKSKRITKKKRLFHYFLFWDSTQGMIIRQRQNEDIWKKLYELPMIEKEDLSTNIEEDFYALLDSIGIEPLNEYYELYNKSDKSKIYKQTLTHQTIHATFTYIPLKTQDNKINRAYYFVKPRKVFKFAFPKILKDYITQFLSHQNIEC